MTNQSVLAFFFLGQVSGRLFQVSVTAWQKEAGVITASTSDEGKNIVPVPMRWHPEPPAHTGVGWVGSQCFLPGRTGSWVLHGEVINPKHCLSLLMIYLCCTKHHAKCWSNVFRENAQVLNDLIPAYRVIHFLFTTLKALFFPKADGCLVT